MIKDSVERVLASWVVTSLTRRRLRGRTLILAYHAIIPYGERGGVGERSLYVSQQQFSDQLDALGEIADVVSLQELDDVPPDPRRPSIAITFDDAYLGAVTCAIDELEARGMPATIFVAPGYLGSRVFWWDALAHDTGEMPTHVRSHALEALRGSGPLILEWARKKGLRVHDDLPPFARSATTDETLAASRRPGITLGSHSWSHANLARLSAHELTEELQRSRDWLMERAHTRYVRHLAYPYGLDSPVARDAAASAGYASGLCIVGGWHDRATAPRFARPRLNVGAGMSLNGFRARLLGSRRA